MTYNTLSLDIDADGIAVCTFDLPGRSMNVLTRELMEELGAVVDRFCAEDDIKGLVLASAKPTGFFAGADLSMIAGIADLPDIGSIYEEIFRLQMLFRRIETAGRDPKALFKGQANAKPVVAALAGMTLGGGCELSLACHYRLAADNGKVKLGQPEVKVGLIPGAGGTQRIMRLAGVQNAMQVCTQGNNLDANAAKAMGLIDEIVPEDELISRAKEWIKANPNSTARWDRKGFKIPGGAGAMDPRVVPTFAGASAIAQGQTNHNYPAVQRILSSIYEGSIVPFDVGIRIETKYFVKCLAEPQAKNMIRTLFINKTAAEKGAARPESASPTDIRRVGVLGAGMMGAGIAYVSARAGLEVVLLDRDVEAAEKGKDYSVKLNQKGVSRAKMTKADAEALEARITTTADYSALADVDLVIEAVFEDPKVKADVIAKTEAVIGEGTIFATNTSTIPIGSLAENSKAKDRYIGIHFFSPVDKMPLVEIIPHADTGDQALATAIDYVAKIKKTPIVVRDVRGFYCNSVVVPYLNEAMLMVKEGIKPALIENAAVHMGMPVGPLALTDEISLELGLSIAKAAQAAEGDRYTPTGTEDMLEEFVTKLGRKGKKVGKGFYDYPEDGSKKRLWPGLSEHYPLAEEQPTVEEVQERLMYLQLVLAARLYDADVVHDPQSADLGAIFGWGFCPWTGGPMSHIDTIGLDTFVRTADRLAEKHGDRFAVPQSFRDRAGKGDALYAA